MEDVHCMKTEFLLQVSGLEILWRDQCLVGRIAATPAT
jgi:hypothetical protein